jgi:hypothetical protein
MTPETKPSPAELLVLGQARDRVIAKLSEAFAHDVIDVDEFEQRLTLAHRASTLIELEAAVRDVAPAETEIITVPAAGRRTLAPALPADRVLAIFGGVERCGQWAVPRRLNVSALMGGVLLDFREAVLSAGVTEIHVTALMGGVQIVVPPNLAVELSGTAVMGGFAHVERIPTILDLERPLLRVTGFAMMGGVAVETRLPGESERDAHRRRRHTRKLLRGGREAKLLPERSDR